MNLKATLGQLVQVGPPFFEHVAELGQIALDADQRRAAWALLSPLSEVRKVDKELKASLRDMRKEFDGATLPAVADDDRERIIHRKHDMKLEEVLAEVDAKVGPLGATAPEEITASAPALIAPNTGLGRVLKVSVVKLS